MRRWVVLPVVALLALGACGNEDDVTGEGDEQGVVADDIGTAVEVAKLSLPSTISDDAVADLIQDLCIAAGTGDTDPVVAQLVASTADPAQLPSNLDAVAAGAGTYCPDDVDDILPVVQQALSPSTTTPTTAGAAGATSGSSSGSSASTSGASGGGSNSGGASTQSSGSASVGGGNATGTGNSSSTDFSQGASSSNSASSGDGASSATTG
jgi:hypothetical protein